MTPITAKMVLQQAQAHFHKGDFIHAERLCREVLGAYPGHAGAMFGLSAIAHSSNRPGLALECITSALQAEPGNVMFLNQLGVVHLVAGRLEHAEDAFKRALQAAPASSTSMANLGSVCIQRGELNEATRLIENAIQAEPGNAEAHFYMGIVSLLNGDFVRGWKELEWRLKSPALSGRNHKFSQPVWDGSGLNGRILLVHVEQGFGDVIQFCRYVQLLVRTGNIVVFGCTPPLERLMRQSDDMGLIVIGDPLPKFDLVCPVMSMPLKFSTTLENIPSHTPYLKADPLAVQSWAARRGPGLNVGLVWAGRPTHKNDRGRSIALAQLAPLANIPDMHFVSLQKGPREDDPAPEGMSLTRVGDQITDFADTAAVIESLDLVISVDTAVVHLAGALNKPCWVLLPFAPDWRWMLGRTDSPWYPSLRLYRQNARGDWASVIARVAEDLAGLSSQSHAVQ